MCVKEEVLLLKKQIIADRALMGSLSSAHEQQLHEYVLLIENKENEIKNLQEMLNERIAPDISADAEVVPLTKSPVQKPGELPDSNKNNDTNLSNNSDDKAADGLNNKCWTCNDDLFGYVIPCASCRREYHSICIKKNQANIYVCNTCMT